MAVTSYAKVGGSIPGSGCTDLYFASGTQEDNRQSIGSTVSDTILVFRGDSCGQLQLGGSHWAISV